MIMISHCVQISLCIKSASRVIMLEEHNEMVSLARCMTSSFNINTTDTLGDDTAAITRGNNPVIK